MIKSNLIQFSFRKFNKILNLQRIEKKLLNLSRKFLLDLNPNILYARGDLVELLISSDVAKYCEFKMVSQILTIDNDGSLQKVNLVSIL